jgi:hypothetical protein
MADKLKVSLAHDRTGELFFILSEERAAQPREMIPEHRAGILNHLDIEPKTFTDAVFKWAEGKTKVIV